MARPYSNYPHVKPKSSSAALFYYSDPSEVHIYIRPNVVVVSLQSDFSYIIPPARSWDKN